MSEVLTKKIESRIKRFTELRDACHKTYKEEEMSARVRSVAFGNYIGYSEAVESLESLKSYVEKHEV